MGQKRVALVDLSSEGGETKKISQKKAARTVGKTYKGGKGTGRIVDKSESIEDIETAPLEEEKPTSKEAAIEIAPHKKKVRERGRRYRLARSKIDRTKTYPLDQAIDLVKKSTIARFTATITAHLNLSQDGILKEIVFPHPTGKTIRVAIASDSLIADVEKGKTDFDILLATPALMPKIAKIAKILGPLGLMPNPKNGTVTEDPEKRKTELESGLTQVKSEPKTPLMHTVIGKTSNSSTDLCENLKALILGVGPKTITKLTLASTMSPGVKVDLTEFQKTT